LIFDVLVETGYDYRHVNVMQLHVFRSVMRDLADSSIGTSFTIKTHSSNDSYHIGGIKSILISHVIVANMYQMRTKPDARTPIVTEIAQRTPDQSPALD
jgi:hypothetical protein